MKESAKMKTETKKSVLEQLKEFVIANEKFTTQQAVEGTKLNRNQIYTALWKLGKLGMITRVGEGQYERTGLTPVNKTVKKRKAKAKPSYTLTDRVQVAERDKRYLKERLDELTFRMARVNAQHEDALAIIRYLEDKLFKAIQFDAKKNGNT